MTKQEKKELIRQMRKEHGLYPNWFPIMLLVGTIVYVFLCIFVFFPMIDKVAK